MSQRFSRRSLLSRAGVGAAFVPMLGLSHSYAGAAAGPVKRRLVIIQTTNGVIAKSFFPDAADVGLANPLPAILSPLEPHKRDIIVFGGIDLKSALDDIYGHANSHDDAGHLLTGMQGAKGNKPGYNEDAPVANTASVDQVIATDPSIKGAVPFPSLELGVSNGFGHDNNELARYVSYRGPAIASTPARPDGVLTELNPYNAFKKLFAMGMQQDVSTLDALRAKRRSVLDFVGADLGRLANRLGKEDGDKVRAHLQSISELEKQLATLPSVDCRGPQLPQGVPTDGKDEISQIPKVTKMHLDIIVTAMACDLTRVATVMLTGFHNAQVIMSWLGDEFTGKGDEFPLRDHHDITHRQYQSPDHTRRKVIAETWFMSQFAYLIQAMKQVREMKADGTPGTMLDNSVVAILNSGSDGGAHSVTNLPWVIAGGCGGYFKTGRYLKYDKAPHNGLLVAFCNAMGVPRTSFGDPKYGGELPGVRG